MEGRTHGVADDLDVELVEILGGEAVAEVGCWERGEEKRQFTEEKQVRKQRRT
jgi:hypothetical protein